MLRSEQRGGAVSQDSSKSTQDMLVEGLEHHKAGRLKKAERIYRRILAIDPRHADSLHLLGMIAFQSGQLETAADLIRKAIAFNRRGTSYFSNLGNVMYAQGKLEEAKALYRHALLLKPDLVEALVNLGNVLQAQGKFDESVVCYERALALKPDNAETHNNLGNARQMLGSVDEAIACYEKSLAIRPAYAEAYSNLGNARRNQDRLEEAIAFHRQALAVNPEYAEAHYNLGIVLLAQGKVDEALVEYEKALASRPDHAQAAFGRALTQLLQGNFSIGWQNFEWRWKSVDHDTPRRAYSQPMWTGEKLSSGSLLLWGEQGIGDEVMFAGMIPDVVRTGNHCILDCDSRLNTLFARSFPGVEVVSASPDSQAGTEVVSQLPTGSLPGIFRKTSSAFAATTSSYLIADPKEQDRLRAGYSDGRRLVGLAWHTKNIKTGRFRSIDLRLFAPLFQLPDIRWVSLQYGDHDELANQAAEASAPVLIDSAVDQLADIDVFAAQIAALDLVITIDNSTAHLAGALGVPVWVLLPFAPDWRWLLDREDSPWYPTMRLFRQRRPGDWDSVIERVRRAL
jgi:tetratricopeptide (TPR) repeat protein